MTLHEWALRQGARANMVGLELRSPTGEEWNLRNAWRVGEDEPAEVGLMLLPAGQTTGTLKTIFIPYKDFMEWEVIEPKVSSA